MMIDHQARIIGAKIVYCGAGMSGKTTNLEYIHLITNPKAQPGPTSPSGDKERRRIFDFLPVSLGKIKGYQVQLHLYSVPGQVFCEDSRKIILEGVDGVVFVVDSRRSRIDAALESFDSMNLKSIPIVLQYNKRDAADIFSVPELEKIFNTGRVPYFEAIASNGVGVFETFKHVGKLILRNITD